MEPAAPARTDPRATEDAELRLLGEQLHRMRGMLFAYSALFFRRILAWTVIVLALLILGSTSIAPAAVVPVPFLVPFAFLETGYLFFYTVFARRFAAHLEQAIDRRLGRDILIAHRLEAAYFLPPEQPRIAAFSFGDPLGFTSVATIGYTAGAGILWLAGLLGLEGYVSRLEEPELLAFAVPAAIVWTVVIAAYLVWGSLAKREERRMLAVLDAWGSDDRRD